MQEVDAPLQGKMIEDPLPVDENSKMRPERQLRQEAGPCPDLIFPILKIRRPL